jgi:hypothetical protein
MSALTNKFVNRLFRKVEGVVWDLTTNQIGLQNQSGIFTLTTTVTPADPDNNVPESTVYGVSVNPIESFGFKIPAFAQNTPLADINVGDLIIGDNKALGWVVKVNPNSLVLLDQNGFTKQYNPPKLAVVGVEGALVVKSLTGLFGNAGASGFSNALLPLMLMGEGGLGGGGLDDMLPILLMTQQTGGSANSMASMLPTILLMKSLKGGKADDMLTAMLLSQSMANGQNAAGGLGGINPMMLMMLSGNNGGGSIGTTFVAGGAPVPTLNPATPPLTRVR